MEQWYQNQEFFSEARLDRIKAWMSQDVIDIFLHYDSSLTLAV